MADPEKATDEPAAAEPAPVSASKLGFFERRRRRAELSRQLAVREQLLLELGAIVYELHRQGQRNPELLQTRAAELDAIDGEVRAMQASLDRDDPASWPAPAWEPPEDRWDADRADAWEPGDDRAPTGEWTAEDGDGWDRGRTDEWEAEDDWEPAGEAAPETREWRPEDEWEDGSGEWADPDEDLGETQEWSAEEVEEALGGANGASPPDADEPADAKPGEERS